MIPIDPNIPELELRVFGEHQPQYIPLPARVDSEGAVITCWRLSWGERLIAFFRGTFFITVLSFNERLQPIRVSIDKPEMAGVKQ